MVANHPVHTGYRGSLYEMACDADSLVDGEMASDYFEGCDEDYLRG